jgi:hypothetical protein
MKSSDILNAFQACLGLKIVPSRSLRPKSFSSPVTSTFGRNTTVMAIMPLCCAQERVYYGKAGPIHWRSSADAPKSSGVY